MSQMGCDRLRINDRTKDIVSDLAVAFFPTEEAAFLALHQLKNMTIEDVKIAVSFRCLSFPFSLGHFMLYTRQFFNTALILVLYWYPLCLRERSEPALPCASLAPFMCSSYISYIPFTQFSFLLSQPLLFTSWSPLRLLFS